MKLHDEQDRRFVPVSNVEVASLLCTCGDCGADVHISYDDLDVERGCVDVGAVAEECPECGVLCDLSRVRFMSGLVRETETLVTEVPRP